MNNKEKAALEKVVAKGKKLAQGIAEKQQQEAEKLQAAKAEYAACKTATQKCDCLAKYYGLMDAEETS